MHVPLAAWIGASLQAPKTPSTCIGTSEIYCSMEFEYRDVLTLYIYIYIYIEKKGFYSGVSSNSNPYLMPSITEAGVGARCTDGVVDHNVTLTRMLLA